MGRLTLMTLVGVVAVLFVAALAQAGPPPAMLPTLLGPVTKQSGCRFGSLPDRACTPGSFWGNLTQAGCPGGYHGVPALGMRYAQRSQVIAGYGLMTSGRIAVVPLIPLSLAGAADDPANLVPMTIPAASAHARLGRALAQRVCAGQLSFDKARTEIATNWRSLYLREFRSVAPT